MAFILCIEGQCYPCNESFMCWYGNFKFAKKNSVTLGFVSIFRTGIYFKIPALKY